MCAICSARALSVLNTEAAIFANQKVIPLRAGAQLQPPFVRHGDSCGELVTGCRVNHAEPLQDL